jgi:uroporphyrinogen-III synthase
MARYKVLSTKRLDPSLVDRAKEHGVEIIEQEFIAVQPLISEEVYRQLRPWIEKTDPSYAVFTSAKGVEAVKYYLTHKGTAHTPNWKVFCISGKTREAVSSMIPGASILATAEYGAILAQRIIAHGGVKEVVFFCGNKRREELPSGLQEAGITVHEIVVYETEDTPVVVEEDLDAVLFFSPSGVSSFFSANQLKKEAVCFAIGRSTAEAIAAFTHNLIIISDTPIPEAMLAAVYHYTQTINYPK